MSSNIRMDAGYYHATNGSQPSAPPPDTSLGNYFLGITTISTNISTSPRVIISQDASISFTGTVTLLNISYFRLLNIICPTSSPYYYPINNLCYSTCLTGFYGETANNSQFCLACSLYCLTCNGPSTSYCITCNPSQNRIILNNATSNSCICMDGYFDNSTVLCVQCQSTCLTCINATSCSTCNNANNMTVNGSFCGCLQTLTYSNYYLTATNKSCQLCADLVQGCLQCDVNNNCTSCFTPNFTSTSGSGSNVICSCNTTYENYVPVNVNCILCSDLIVGCTNCSDIGTCTNCNLNLYFNLNQTFKNCSCIDGYYFNSTNNTCLSCQPPCLTCSQTASNCLSCDPAINRTLVDS